MKKRRKFTPEEKLSILKYGEENGVMESCRRFGIANSLYYKWRDKYETEGIEGLQPRYTKRQDHRLSELEKENLLLKKLLAEKEMELSLAKELIKKKYQTK